MKNKGLIITLIILLSIIVIGLTSFLIMILSGNIDFPRIFNIRINLNSNENVILDKNFDIEGIENIKISAETGDIKFEKSFNDKIRVVAYGDDVEDIELLQSEDTIEVKNTKEKGKWLNFLRNKNDIIIYIPNNFSYTINIDAQYGNVEMVDLENATVQINSDYGNVKLGDIKNAYIVCDYGNIEIEKILNRCDIEADCGNVKIQEAQLKENSNITADLGNIKIENINDIFIDAKTDLGKSRIRKNNNNSPITLKIKCDFGNINIED